MSSFFLALHTILPLFLIVFFGIVMIRLKVATIAWVDILNKYALRIGFPALIYYFLQILIRTIRAIAANRINHLILSRIMNRTETVINPNKFS